MNNQERLVKTLEMNGYLPGAFVKTQMLLSGLMNYQKEKRAGVILELLRQCSSEREYRSKLDAIFPETRK